MEEQNDLLRMISQALQENKLINDEILRLLRQTNLHDVHLQNLKSLLSKNASTLELIKNVTPIN
jgi:hypothetical protein